MQYYLHCQQKDNSHVKIAYQIEGVDPNKHGGIVERSSGTTQDHGVGPPESNDQSHLASSQKPPGTMILCYSIVSLIPGSFWNDSNWLWSFDSIAPTP
jgi:hypothetical protein